MTALERTPLHGDSIGRCEPGHPVKGRDALFGEALFSVVRDRVGEAPPEGNQLLPVDARLSRDAAPVHAARKIDRLGAAHQHFLGIWTDEAVATGATVLGFRDRAASEGRKDRKKKRR